MKGDKGQTICRCRQSSGIARRGLSLLEVMISLAILAASIVVTSELVRSGSRGAVDARDCTTAQLLCENLMAEIAAGVQPLDTVSRATHPENSEWLYSIAIEQIDQQGLLSVEVYVEKNTSPNKTGGRRPLSYRLVRWMLDPNFEASLAAQAAELEAAYATEEESTTETNQP